MKHAHLALTSLLTLAACSTDDDAAAADAGPTGGSMAQADSGPPPDLDKRPSVEAVGEATDTALAGIPPTPRDEPVEVVIAEKARIVPPPRDTTGGRDLAAPVAGREGSIRYDIDGDGDEDDVYTFVPDRQDFAFLAWEEDGYCHLAWSHYEVSRYVFSRCVPPAGTETFVCTQGENGAPRRCQKCEGEACEPCDARIEEGAAVCLALPPGMGLPPPDAGLPADAGEPDHPDAGHHPPDGGSVDPGVCSTECMSQSGATCCTTCGCEAEIRCDPQCDSPYQWDCEIGCCFDYEIFECASESPR